MGQNRQYADEHGISHKTTSLSTCYDGLFIILDFNLIKVVILHGTNNP